MGDVSLSPTKAVLGDAFWKHITSPERGKHEGHLAGAKEPLDRGPLHIPHLEHRPLFPAEHPETGLNSGDVVVFLQRGQPCCVAEAHLEAGEHIAYVLDLASQGAHGKLGSPPGAGEEGVQGPGHQDLGRHFLLEVVRQGSFLGFRAPAASWRYMQPRRKAPHRLVFFNLNLGIWEQWEVASGDPWTHPWSSIHLVLRSRRLPNITLDLQVLRIGKYGTSPIARVPPCHGLAAGASENGCDSPHGTSAAGGHSKTGSPGLVVGGTRKLLQFSSELGEDEHLRRISSMLVQEWVRFVDVEKALRAEVEEQVIALVEEVAQLRMDTIGQVEFLRSEMNSEIIGLFDLAQMREYQLQQAQAMRRRVLAVVVAAQWRRKAFHVMQLIMEAWLQVGTRKSRVAQARRRADRHTLASAFNAWEAHTVASATLTRLLFRGIMGTSHKIMQRAWQGWREILSCRALGRQHLLSLALRNEFYLLADAFEAWQQVRNLQASVPTLVARLQARWLQRMLAEVLQEWWAVGRRKQVLRAMGARCAKRSTIRLVHTALLGWSEVVEKGLRLRAIGAAVQEHSDAQLCNAALVAWQQRTRHAGIIARKLRAHLAKGRRSQQAVVMESWEGIVHDAQTTRAKLRRAHQRRVARLQHAAFCGWAEVAADKAMKQRRVARLRHAASRHVMSTALCVLWEQVHLARVRQRIIHKRTRASLLRAFQAWSGVCARCAQGAALLRSMARAHAESRLKGALREWAFIAKWHALHCFAAMDCLPGDTKHVMTVALGAWWQQCIALDQPWASQSGTGCTSHAQSGNSQHSLGVAAGGEEAARLGRSLDASDPTQGQGVDSTKEGTDSCTLFGRMAWLACVVLLAWQGTAAEQHALRAVLERQHCKAKWRLAAAVLHEWSAVVGRVRGARALALGWARSCESGMLSQVLFSWHHEVQDGKAREQALARHADYTSQAKLRAMLLSWGDVVANMAHTRQAAEGRASELQRALLHDVLSAWVEFMVARRTLSAQAVHAVSKMSKLRLQLALDAWLEGVFVKQARAARDTRAANWHKHRQLLACFMALQDFAHQAHTTRVKLAAAVMRNSTARMTSVFSMWAAHTQHAAVLRYRANSITRRRFARTLAMALVGWAGQHHDLKALRAKMSRFMHAQGVKLQRAVLQEWARTAHCHIKGREMLALWAFDYTQGMLGCVLDSWWQQAQAGASRRSAVYAAYECRSSRMLALAWGAWQRQCRAHAFTQEIVAQALRRITARELRACFLAWHSACKHRAWRLSMLEVSVQKRYTAICGGALAAWSGAVRTARVQRHGMDRLQRRRDLRSLQLHLHTWHQTVMENRRRMEGLKACIKRKKVAFQLFKAWYWDAFDSDVQETIRRMFHTTSSTTPKPRLSALPRPPPQPSIAQPVASQPSAQNQETVASAAAAAAKRPGSYGSLVAYAATGQIHSVGGSNMSVQALLKASERARYGRAEHPGHGHGSMGVVMHEIQRSPSTRLSVHSSFPASQPPPRTTHRPDPGTPTKVAHANGAVPKSNTTGPESNSEPVSSPTSPQPPPGFQGFLHSNDLFVAQHEGANGSKQTDSGAHGSMSSPEWGSPVKRTAGQQDSEMGPIQFGRYNDLYSESEDGELPEFVA